MAFSLTHEVFEPGKDYLLLSSDGDISLDVLPDFAPRIAIAIQHHNCMRLVEDLRNSAFNLDTNGIIETQKYQADFLTDRGIPFTKVKRAIVVNEDRINPDDIAFFEQLSVNNGQKVKVFTDLYKAIEWITSD
jgi:hypothetical protein